MESKATTTNPKDLMGLKKVSISKLPAIAVAHGAHAMMDGARKYGAYNWRSKSVIASIYVDAAKRHLDYWLEGQEVAADSLVHHLGHTIACCAILLDAQATGNLLDDRPMSPTSSEAYGVAIAQISEAIAMLNVVHDPANPVEPPFALTPKRALPRLIRFEPLPYIQLLSSLDPSTNVLSLDPELYELLDNTDRHMVIRTHELWTILNKDHRMVALETDPATTLTKKGV